MLTINYAIISCKNVMFSFCLQCGYKYKACADSKIRKVQVYRKYYYDGYSLTETFLESYFRRRKSNLDSTLNRLRKCNFEELEKTFKPLTDSVVTRL